MRKIIIFLAIALVYASSSYALEAFDIPETVTPGKVLSNGVVTDEGRYLVNADGTITITELEVHSGDHPSSYLIQYRPGDYPKMLALTGKIHSPDNCVYTWERCEGIARLDDCAGLGGLTAMFTCTPTQSNRYQGDPPYKVTLSHEINVMKNDIIMFIKGETSNIKFSYAATGVEHPEDQDGDGSSPLQDCDDLDQTVYPDAPEICDGKANKAKWHEDAEGNPVVGSHCEPQGNIDTGCDADSDDYCSMAKNVSLEFLQWCCEGAGAAQIQGQGCCCNTLSWYKASTGTTDLAAVWTSLDSVVDMNKQRFWTSSKTIGGTAAHIVRGNDCNDGIISINPGAKEVCASEQNWGDDDCDDGTNVFSDGAGIVAYSHWDDSWMTGINEGCEDNNKFDCEHAAYQDAYLGVRPDSGFWWIGSITGSNQGSCCGNNTYTLTSSSTTGYKRTKEFFPYWNLEMKNYIDSYEYSGCWDSLPVRNNDTAAVNMLYMNLPGAIVLTSGRSFDYATVSGMGILNLPEDPLRVEPGQGYTLHMNITLDAQATSTATVYYMENISGTWDHTWKGTGISMRGGQGSRMMEFDYSPSAGAQDVLFFVYLNGAGTLRLRDTTLYNSEYKKALNIEGAFHTCDVPDPSWFTQQVNTYSTANLAYPNPLILPQDHRQHDEEPGNCTVVGDYFCSYDGTWKKNVDSKYANKVNYIPETPAALGTYFGSYSMEKDCCPIGYCWDGMMCHAGNPGSVGVHIRNITVQTGSDPETRNYKCVLGTWQNATLKPDQNNMTTGYCGERQCLYSPLDGSTQLCVNSGNYTFDDYCLEGGWTSRTSLIAMQLVQLSIEEGNGNYVLFCDGYENALNDYDYTDPVVGSVIEYIAGTMDDAGETFDCGYGGWNGVPGEGQGCVNNFCVIKYETNAGKEKVAFGTSLNLPINATAAEWRDLSFLRLFDVRSRNIVPDSADHYTYCDGVIEQGKDSYLGCDGPDSYVKHGTEHDLWYNMRTQSMIYSPQKIDLGEYSVIDAFGDLLKAPFTTIINFIRGIPRDKYEREDYSFLEGVGKFSRIYLNEKFVGSNHRSIRGVVEKVGAEEGMVVDYVNFGIDLCRKADEYSVKHFSDCIYGPMYCPLSCEPSIYDADERSFHIESKSDEGRGLWADLTSKIRLDEEHEEGGSTTDLGSSAITIAFSGSLSILNPINFTVDDPSLPSQKDIMAYTWDFGSERSYGTRYAEEGMNATHTFTHTGGMTVSVRILDRNFNYYYAERTIDIDESPDGGVCNLNEDCEHDYCNPNGRCSVQNCSDGWKNQDESDVDCGDVCAGEGKRCHIRGVCASGADCNSGNCVNNVCWYVQDSCTVSWEGCANDENAVFSISSTTDAHVSSDPADYDLKICCKDFARSWDGTAGIDGVAEMMGLSAETDAHAEKPELTNYDANSMLIIGDDGGGAACNYGINGGCPGQVCVVGISSETDAHVGACEFYYDKICCGAIPLS